MPIHRKTDRTFLHKSCIILQFFRNMRTSTVSRGMMETMNLQATQREQQNRAELIERIAGTVQEDGVLEPLPGVHLARASRSMEGIHSVYPTAFCVIAQGA